VAPIKQFTTSTRCPEDGMPLTEYADFLDGTWIRFYVCNDGAEHWFPEGADGKPDTSVELEKA
jgi:hypothetical protein